MDTFLTAAREWQSLLRDVGDAFVAQHLEASMQVAVALHCAKEGDAERVAAAVTSAERRDFLALSAVLRRLLEPAAREHMTFLLPAVASDKATLLVKRQTLVQSLPEAFELRFRQLLESHWGELTQTQSTTFSLPRVRQLDWRVIREGEDKRLLLRLQTSDGQTRTIYVPGRQFHELRHSVASVLQEMSQVEAHPMMRLAYMEQRSHVTSDAP
ncbi:hypothetical protein PRNP1_004443 [Phytophthora ramorum]